MESYFFIINAVFSGVRAICCPKQDIVTERLELLMNSRASTSVSYSWSEYRIDKKSNLTFLSEQNGIRKHTEMNESG